MFSILKFMVWAVLWANGLGSVAHADNQLVMTMMALTTRV